MKARTAVVLCVVATLVAAYVANEGHGGAEAAAWAYGSIPLGSDAGRAWHRDTVAERQANATFPANPTLPETVQWLARSSARKIVARTYEGEHPTAEVLGWTHDPVRNRYFIRALLTWTDADDADRHSIDGTISVDADGEDIRWSETGADPRHHEARSVTDNAGMGLLLLVALAQTTPAQRRGPP